MLVGGGGGGGSVGAFPPSIFWGSGPQRLILKQPRQIATSLSIFGDDEFNLVAFL